MKNQIINWVAMLVLTLILAGCSTHTYPMSKAFPESSSAFSGGAPVTLQPIQESVSGPSKNSDYQANPNYLGSDLTFLEMEVIIPIVWFEDTFVADTPRRDIVRSALVSKLASSGIIVAGDSEAVSAAAQLPEDHLNVSVQIQDLSVKTALNGFLTVIITSGFSFKNQVCHAALECEFRQPGQDKPVWEGVVEGTCRTSDKDVGGYAGSPENTFERIVERTNVVAGAVSAAIEQCVVKLAEVRTKVSNERYARLMKEGAGLEAEGDTAKALEDYGHASTSATTVDQDTEAMQSLGRLLRVIGTPPVLPEEARKLKVQAEAAFREGRFDAASQLYGDTLNLSPWWAEGHSELALLLGAGGHYSQAIREMKCYVTLVPNAPDARNAQDKLYEWEQKMASQAPAAPVTPTVNQNSDKSMKLQRRKF